MKKRVFAVIFAVMFIVSFSEAKTINSIEDPDTCENFAVDIYWWTLDLTGSWQEANQDFENAYLSCCFNYPNDCGGLVIIDAE